MFPCAWAPLATRCVALMCKASDTNTGSRSVKKDGGDLRDEGEGGCSSKKQVEDESRLPLLYQGWKVLPAFTTLKLKNGF